MKRQLLAIWVGLGLFLISAAASANVRDNYQFAVVDASPYSTSVNRVGKVNYLDQLTLSFNSTGYVELLLLDVGDEVAAGQTMAQLDASDFQYQKQGLEHRRSFVAKERKRIAKLVKDKLLPKSSLDAIATDYKELTARIKQIDYKITKATLKSDVKGKVSKRLANKAELVAPGQGIYVVVPTDDNLLASFYLTDDEIAQVQEGEVMTVEVNASGQTVQGKVSRVAITPESSGLYRLDLKLDEALLAGTNVTLRLTSEPLSVFSIGHHTPVEINADSVVVMIKEGEDIRPETMKVVAMDNDFIHVLAQRDRVEFVTNGWISR